MFIELVAKPIPKVMEDSTPRNLATSSSSSSCMLRLPARTGITGSHFQVISFDLCDGITVPCNSKIYMYIYFCRYIGH